jgi:hypothetical protein
MLLLACVGTGEARAGVSTDDMSKCLVASTSHADRAILMKWVFFAMASNPEVSSMATISASQRSEVDKATAGLFQRLLTVSCRKQVVDAIRSEGSGAIQSAFQVLGIVAGRELSGNAKVAESTSGMMQLVDAGEMKKLQDEASTAAK